MSQKCQDRISKVSQMEKEVGYSNLEMYEFGQCVP